MDWIGIPMTKSLGRLVLAIMAVQAGQACWAQQIIGRIRPEKQPYLVGEPVFVVLDPDPSGSARPARGQTCSLKQRPLRNLAPR